TFVVKFFQRNGRPYPISSEDNLKVEITQGSYAIPSSTELGGCDPRSANTARVQFTAKRSGSYCISILIGPNPTHIRGSPFTDIYFLPTHPSPQETGFINYCSTVVCTEKTPHALFIKLRDKYGNLCPISQDFDASDDFAVDLVEMSTGKPIHSAFYWDIQPSLSRIALVLRLDNEGLYSAIVSYRGSALKNGEFSIIVLNSTESALVQKHSSKKSQTSGFCAKLMTQNNDRLNKPKRVFCYISPKQLTIKEYILKIIPKRIVTFRLCPSTKFQFSKSDNQSPSDDNNTDLSNQLLIIDDGCQPPVELMSDERNVIAATFTQFLLNNIGGSETFKDKQDFFYSEVRKYHQKSFHEKHQIRIDRQNLLESSIKATKSLTTSDWCKNFELQFIGELGVDWGGLRREWFELLSGALFDPNQSDLFQRFKNDRQGLVQPNPKSQFKLKYYEFAGKIVGKCLYESALGSSYRQLVRARFSRSFLAQLIGLRVHYKYFERDDPDLYVSKIKYIIDNDVEDMELYFSEDEYDMSSGKLIRTIDLIPNGSKVKVTNANKLQYLDALALYRLSTSVREPIEHFLKGLNDLIPDNLLCIFDENELELLMCGSGNYSISEFKANHAVSCGNYEFRKILDWFWTAVSNFTDEEMARLLQFTTGCSQLPPGGFQELNPKFHITSAPTFGVLPTAHTCFNQICLPEYDSYEQFERALRIAITEGGEGFGMI
ncbi:unnamed protein product, partial [Oppiella nova]